MLFEILTRDVWLVGLKMIYTFFLVLFQLFTLSRYPFPIRGIKSYFYLRILQHDFYMIPRFPFSSYVVLGKSLPLLGLIFPIWE